MRRSRARCGDEPNQVLWMWGADVNISAVVLSMRVSVFQCELLMADKKRGAAANLGGALRFIRLRDQRHRLQYQPGTLLESNCPSFRIVSSYFTNIE